MNKPASYTSLVAKIQSKRLKYVNKLAVVLSFAIGLLMSWGNGSIWWNIVATLAYRTPALVISLLMIRMGRDRFTSVVNRGQNTIFSHIWAVVISKQVYLLALYYISASAIVFTLRYSECPIDVFIVSKEYRERNRINDDLVFFIFGSFFLASTYSTMMVLFERNKLPTKPGVFRITPQNALFSGLPRLLARSLALSIISIVATWVSYIFFGRHLIYRLGKPILLILSLDQPNQWASFQIICRTLITSFYCILSWEIINHIYNVYASIGCLDGKKTISSFSSDPITTLIGGLKSAPNGITRMMAYQELAYLSTTSDLNHIKLRQAIFNAKIADFWPSILDECSFVIREVTSRVNKRKNVNLIQKSNPETVEIFGNSLDKSKPTQSISSNLDVKKYPLKDQKPVKVKQSNWITSHPYFIKCKTQIYEPLASVSQTLIDLLPISMDSKRTLKMFEIKFHIYQSNFLDSSFAIPFRNSIYLDTRGRIDDPTTYGNAIIAVSNLLIKSIDEDRKGVVKPHHVAEVLSMLERLKRACDEYTTNPPVIDSSIQSNEHLVAKVHDWCMTQFFDICITFNHKLNDLILPPRVFKLAKTVIDIAIAQQQRDRAERIM